MKDNGEFKSWKLVLREDPYHQVLEESKSSIDSLDQLYLEDGGSEITTDTQVNEKYDFALTCYPNLETMNAEELKTALINELSDLQMIAHHCSIIYDHCTHGRISKPNTKPEVVIAEMEDFWQGREEQEGN